MIFLKRVIAYSTFSQLYGYMVIVCGIMPSLVSMGVMLWHDTTPFVMFWLKRAIGPILVSRWKQAMLSRPTTVTV